MTSHDRRFAHSLFACCLGLSFVDLACGGDKEGGGAGGKVTVELEPTAGFPAVEVSATPSSAPDGDLAEPLRKVAEKALKDCKAFSKRALPKVKLTVRWQGDKLKVDVKDTMQDSVKACIAQGFGRYGLPGGAGESSTLVLELSAK